ncbi:MAG: hypothetical protein E2597_15675 [Stenotrophomonas sp.]|nr:hypothetical protein [Stenotrophomonas sp.]
MFNVESIQLGSLEIHHNRQSLSEAKAALLGEGQSLHSITPPALDSPARKRSSVITIVMPGAPLAGFMIDPPAIGWRFESAPDRSAGPSESSNFRLLLKRFGKDLFDKCGNSRRAMSRPASRPRAVNTIARS